jgi:hypothetical protein
VTVQVGAHPVSLPARGLRAEQDAAATGTRHESNGVSQAADRAVESGRGGQGDELWWCELQQREMFQADRALHTALRTELREPGHRRT